MFKPRRAVRYSLDTGQDQALTIEQWRVAQGKIQHPLTDSQPFRKHQFHTPGTEDSYSGIRIEID